MKGPPSPEEPGSWEGVRPGEGEIAQTRISGCYTDFQATKRFQEWNNPKQQQSGTDVLDKSKTAGGIHSVPVFFAKTQRTESNGDSQNSSENNEGFGI